MTLLKLPAVGHGRDLTPLQALMLPKVDAVGGFCCRIGHVQLHPLAAVVDGLQQMQVLSAVVLHEPQLDSPIAIPLPSTVLQNDVPQGIADIGPWHQIIRGTVPALHRGRLSPGA